MRRAFIAFALLVFLNVGCSKPEAAFVGKWQLDPKGVKSSDPKAEPNIGSTLGFMLLDFKLDKTFVMSSRGGDDSGTFGVDSGIVTMTVTASGSGQAVKAYKGKLATDQKSMTVTGSGSPLSLKFVKL
jgi:hypothetical protein